MAKPLKDKEAYQRLNFLYQAAHCVLSQNPENVELARFYTFTQRNIARRLVLRQDPSVKRTLCKKCFSLLIPGVTATARQKRKTRKARFTVVRCLSCGQTKRLLNNPDYCLWADRPEAQLEQQQQQQQQQQRQQQQQQQPGPDQPSKNQMKDTKPDKSRPSKSTVTQSTAST